MRGLNRPGFAGGCLVLVLRSDTGFLKACVELNRPGFTGG